VYHYTSLENALAYILPTQSIKFSQLRKVNDPREAENLYVHVDPEIEFKKVGNVPNEVLNRTVHIWKFINKIRKDEWKVTCFSVDAIGAPKEVFFHEINYWQNLRAGWGIPSMWEAYAVKHSGVCLAFDRMELKVLIENEAERRKQLQPNEKIPPHFSDGIINYKDESLQIPIKLNAKDLPAPNPYEDVLSNQKNKHFLRSIVLSNLENCFFLKSESYINEREYRFIIYDTKEKDIYLNFGKSLKAIIAGNYTSEQGLELLYDYSDQLDCPLYKVNWKNGMPAIGAIRKLPGLGLQGHQ